jgi:WD repeat-containing protein 48
MSFFKTPFMQSNSGSVVSLHSNANSKTSTTASSSNLNASKTRRSLTYILNTSNNVQTRGHHSIGVNSLVYNKYDRSLISGGRDGQISIWKFDEDTVEGRNIFQDNDDVYDNFRSNEEIRKHIQSNLDNTTELHNIETSINEGVSSVRISKRQSLPKYSQNSYLHHFGWINDMKLLGDNQTIASCSNDLSIKLWNYQTNSKSTLGYHDDYIKKIGYTKSHTDQLVSAGLDKVVKVWDITKAQSFSSYKFTDFNNSIYSLDVNKDLIICSGPSNIITLLDKRDLTKPVKTFVGHTDNVRSLILKDYSFLSGSSDASIKLWDLRTTRVLRAFEMHSSPVWSLYTPEYADDFSIFYSADKSGLLLKNDLRASNLHSNNMNDGYFNYKVNESMGISTVLANVNYYNTTNQASSSPTNSNPSFANFESSLSGINDIVETEDLGMIWTATSPSTHDSNTNFISSWAIPQTGKLVSHQGLVLNRKLASLYNANTTPNLGTNSNGVFGQAGDTEVNPFDEVVSQHDYILDTARSRESINDAEDLVSQLSGDALDQIDNALLSNAQGLDNIVLSDPKANIDFDTTIDGKVNVTFAMDDEGNEEEDENSSYGAGEEGSENHEELRSSATCFVGLLGDLNTQFLLSDDYFVSELLSEDGAATEMLSEEMSEFDPFTERLSMTTDQKGRDSMIQVSRKMLVNNEYIDEDDVLLLPFNTKPVSSIPGASGLIRCRILNDRRHVATMDQSGSVYIFDILRCKLVQRVDSHLSISSIEGVDKGKKMTISSGTRTGEDMSMDDVMDDMNPADRFEAVCEKLQTQESLPTWCSAQVKAGQLFITLKENNFASCELYADDFVEYYDKLPPLPDSLSRVNLGKIIIKTFFDRMLSSILTKKHINIHNTMNIDVSQSSDLQDPYLNNSPPPSAEAMSKQKNSSIDVVHVPANNAGAAGNAQPVKIPQPAPQTRVYSGLSNTPNSANTPSPVGSSSDKKPRGFFGRLKTKDKKEPPGSSLSAEDRKNGAIAIKFAKYMEKIESIETTPELFQFLESTPDIFSTLRNQEQYVERERDNINMPVFSYYDGVSADMDDEFRNNTLVVINEETGHETRPAFTIYLDHLIDENYTVDSDELVNNLPAWIAKALILNIYHLTPAMTTKISFKLTPEVDKVNGTLSRVDEDGSISRLNAIGTLRVSRILEFIKNKLPEAEKNTPLELSCRGIGLNERDTLGTAKARIWKDAAEVELVYRRKK